jgi:hypothetical protein
MSMKRSAACTASNQVCSRTGECLLEWDEHGEGRPAPLPMLKDMFANERRKAKVKHLPFRVMLQTRLQ